LSIGGRSRSARSSGKAAPAKKKVRKLKSEIKAPKRRSISSKSEVDLEQVKARAVEALDHLGHQKFSTEPGGYDLKGWLKSLKTMLDDLEEKIGDQLPKEYHEKRKEIEQRFSKPADTSKVDQEVEALRTEESEIREKLQAEADRITARLSAIASDKVGRSKELEEHKSRLKSAQDEKKSASFFSKLMGRSGPDIEPLEKKVADLEKGLKMLEEEALNLHAVRKSLEGKTSEVGLHDGLWKHETEGARGHQTAQNAARRGKAGSHRRPPQDHLRDQARSQEGRKRDRRLGGARGRRGRVDRERGIVHVAGRRTCPGVVSPYAVDVSSRGDARRGQGFGIAGR
jgi:chromosome segregation ATPase